MSGGRYSGDGYECFARSRGRVYVKNTRGAKRGRVKATQLGRRCHFAKISSSKRLDSGSTPGRALYLDYSRGMTGDMFLALLCDLGLDMEPLARIFWDMGIRVTFAAVRKNSRESVGTCMRISGISGQSQQRFIELLDSVGRMPFEESMDASCAVRVRQGIIKALARLADVARKTHDALSDDPYRREMAAAEIFVRVAGAFWGLATLKIRTVTGCAVPWFSGSVATGREVAVFPAQASALLLEGKPVCASKHGPAIITPIGALILDQIVERFHEGPEGILVRSGQGAGPDSGAVRLHGVLTVDGQRQNALETVWVLETHIDHLTGEELGAALERIMEQGALDVLFVPGIMKKGRPGGLLRVLCSGRRLDQVERAVFHHTHTLGVRRRQEERRVLQREPSTLPVAGETVAAKQYVVDGVHFARAEYEALNALVRRTGRSLPALRFLAEE